MTDEQPVALAAEDVDVAGASQEAPDMPVSEVTAPTAEPQQTKKQDRDRLSEMGRKLQKAQEQAARAEALALRQAEDLAQLRAEQQAMRDQDQEAYIASLPPEQQGLERAKRLEARFAHMANASPPAAPQMTQEQKLAYQQRRSQEILDEINDAAELDGGFHLTSDDPLDWTDELTFRASAITVARLRRQQMEEAMASKGSKSTQSSKPAPNGAPSDVAALTKEITEKVLAQVLAELGVGSSMSPKPAGGASTVPTAEDFRKVGFAHDPRKGTKATRERFAELQKRAVEGQR